MQPIIACNEGISLQKNVAQAHLELGTSLPMSNGGRHRSNLGPFNFFLFPMLSETFGGDPTSFQLARKGLFLRGRMNRYNELKLQVLALFASTQGEWLAPK